MEKNPKDQAVIKQAEELIERLQKLQEECRDLLKIFKENPEEYAEAIKTLEWLCGEERDKEVPDFEQEAKDTEPEWAGDD